MAYCAWSFHYRIFRRMRAALASRGWSLDLVTPVPSVYLRARCQGIRCHLVGRGRPGRSYPGADAARTREYLLEMSGIEPLRRFQDALLKTLETLAAAARPAAVAVWNGTDAGTQATHAFARQHGIPAVLLELGNIDSRLLANPDGVNAAARVAGTPELLDSWPISDGEFQPWLSRFKARRLATAGPPQAKASRSLNLFYPLDRIGIALLRIPQPALTPILRKLMAKLQVRGIRPAPAIPPIAPYVFLPLQVGSDSNLLFHSDHDNLAAIGIAARRARELGCALVVKVHPAETDRALVREIGRVCAERGHLLTSFNTAGLILGAAEVVTINSSAGLEALLYGTRVTILGKAIYGGFSAARARAYVLRYLVDFDPFGTAPMTLAALDRVLARMEAP